MHAMTFIKAAILFLPFFLLSQGLFKFFFPHGTTTREIEQAKIDGLFAASIGAVMYVAIDSAMWILICLK